jgi:hypothetical protein
MHSKVTTKTKQEVVQHGEEAATRTRLITFLLNRVSVIAR